MRRAWVSTLGAAVCAVSITNSSASASPSGMTLDAQPVATTTTPSGESWTSKMKFWDRDDDVPNAEKRVFTAHAAKGEEVSPWRHPISYFSSAMAESPVGAAWKKDHPSSKPAPDSISLSTPVAPATPQYYIALAQLAERQGNVVQARQQLQQGLAKWPRDVELLRSAARMEDRQNQLTTAEALYRRAVAADTKNAGVLNDLGLCLARQGKLSESVLCIEQAIALQPTKALYRNNAATVLVEMREDQRALNHLAAVHGPAQSNYNLGQLLVDRGRPHEALMYYQRAAELDPAMEAAQLAMAQLRGETVAPTQVAIEPAVPQQSITPAYGPQLVPQEPMSEPTFPATARGPASGASSYTPPSGYYPSTANPAAQGVQPVAPTYQTATAPRYLPPVQAAPRHLVR